MRRVIAAAAVALLLPAAAFAAPRGPVFDAQGRLIETPFAPVSTAHLTKTRALAIFEDDHKVANWLARYPRKTWVTEVTYSPNPAQCTAGTLEGCWEVKIWSGAAGEIATGRVDDRTGLVSEAWTGPQVAWTMARGSPGAFGGNRINSTWWWVAFCVAFLVGLVDWRRPFGLRTLDLLALLSFSVSLWYFNHGRVLTSVPLVYPPLLYLLGRCVWIGASGRAPRGRSVWPWWALLCAMALFVGFRTVYFNVQSKSVIDVGYSGVIGADRIAHGQSPYGHFPIEGTLKPCGPADASGEIRDRIQTNGRCESADDRGDTYGPVAYESYLPGYALFGWSGKWDSLPAAHFTSIAFDILCVIGLVLVGLRFGGAPLAATLSFAWAAYPFTQYSSSSNTNDAIMPAFLVWGFYFASSPVGRGFFSALSGWAKFATLVVAPLWATYPGPVRRSRVLLFLAGFALATLLAFSVLFLEPSALHATRVFWDRTIAWQVSRDSPFSIWDWRQYHAGLPDLHVVQRILQALLAVAALAAAFAPRRKSPLQLAALTAALILGFQLVLTYWIYLYIPWFFPFVAFAVLASAPRLSRPETEHREHELREPALAG